MVEKLHCERLSEIRIKTQHLTSLWHVANTYRLYFIFFLKQEQQQQNCEWCLKALSVRDALAKDAIDWKILWTHHNFIAR